jgi:tetratricopeptide (TPR) repeat protein
LYIAALEISPKSYKVRFNLAGTYIDLRNDKAAIEEINAILAVDQKELAKVPFRHNWPIKWEYSFESNVIEFRGELLERLGQSKKALADLSEIVRRYPKNPISYQQRANLLLNMHNYRGAIDDARKAMQLDSLSCLCGRVTELKALYSLQNYDEAVSAGDRFLNLPMTDHMRGEAMFFHGLALEKTGEFEKAQQEIEAAHRYAPDYIGATMNRITQAGYYDGSPQDGYSVKASNGLKACILDPEC